MADTNSPKTSQQNNYKHSQLGCFISLGTWKDALNLLNFQIKQKKNNRHYRTISIFYYEILQEKTLVSCMNINPNNYYEKRVATSLFYSLEKEFTCYHYVIPKKGLSLRDYVFFSYPARALYYSLGLYLLRLSQEYLQEPHGKLDNIFAFYGGNLLYKKDELTINKKNIYYRSYYEEYIEKVKQEERSEIRRSQKVAIKLDIENYFGSISIPVLLDKLSNFVKPSVKAELNFDIFAQEQMIFILEYIMQRKGGIPQSENNIISGFIGYLYMSFFDFILDDILKLHQDIIQDYKIIRYVDDIHIFITFADNIEPEKQKEFTLYISSEIAESLYSSLDLRLNLKTRAYHLKEDEDAAELLSRIKDFVDSQGDVGLDYDTILEEDIGSNEDDSYEHVEVDSDESQKSAEKSPQEKINDIFEALNELKRSNVEEFFIRSNAPILPEEVFQEILNRAVQNLVRKPENLNTLEDIFNDFNFDLLKVKPFLLIIIVCLTQKTKEKFRNFLLNKESITISDAELISKYLSQINFDDDELLKKLTENQLFKRIADLVINPEMTCSNPGIYDLSCIHIKKLSAMPEVIDQMRMRVFHERIQSYSVALNHLVNEIHGLCIRKQNADKKQYTANHVFDYLTLMKLPHETRIKIRNLFDRRNSNSVSHPDSDNNIAWEVTEEEYVDYREHVGKCIDYLLLQP